MKPHQFTPAEDKALLAAILTIAPAKLPAVIVFLLIRTMATRAEIVAILKGL